MIGHERNRRGLHVLCQFFHFLSFGTLEKLVKFSYGLTSLSTVKRSENAASTFGAGSGPWWKRMLNSVILSQHEVGRENLLIISNKYPGDDGKEGKAEASSSQSVELKDDYEDIDERRADAMSAPKLGKRYVSTVGSSSDS